MCVLIFTIVLCIGVFCAEDWNNIYRTYDTSSCSSYYMNANWPTNDNGYVFAGKCFKTVSYDATVAKFMKNGEMEWANSYKGFEFFDIEQTSDGGYVAVGISNYGLYGDGFILKLTSTGSVSFAKKLETDNDVVFFRKVTQVAGGKFIVVGQTDLLGFYQAPLIVLFDTDGSVEWSLILGSPKTGQGGSIMEVGTDFMMVGCHTESDKYVMDIVKISNSGNKIFEKKYSNVSMDLLPSSIEAAPGGGYVIAGLRGTGEGSFVTKMDADGNITWIFQYPQISNVPTISVSSDGIYIAGKFNDTQPLLAKLSLADGSIQYSYTKVSSKGVLFEGLSDVNAGGAQLLMNSEHFLMTAPLDEEPGGCDWISISDFPSPNSFEVDMMVGSFSWTKDDSGLINTDYTAAYTPRVLTFSIEDSKCCGNCPSPIAPIVTGDDSMGGFKLNNPLFLWLGLIVVMLL